MPVQVHIGFSYPMNAAVVFSGFDGESVSLIKVINLTFSDGNKSVTLQAQPLGFYEADILLPLAKEKKELPTNMTGTNMNSIYLENNAGVPENGSPTCDSKGCITVWVSGGLSYCDCGSYHIHLGC